MIVTVRPPCEAMVVPKLATSIDEVKSFEALMILALNALGLLHHGRGRAVGAGHFIPRFRCYGIVTAGPWR